MAVNAPLDELSWMVLNGHKWLWIFFMVLNPCIVLVMNSGKWAWVLDGLEWLWMIINGAEAEWCWMLLNCPSAPFTFFTAYSPCFDQNEWCPKFSIEGFSCLLTHIIVQSGSESCFRGSEKIKQSNKENRMYLLFKTFMTKIVIFTI